MNKKIIFSIVALTILLVPTVSIGATQNANSEQQHSYLSMSAKKHAIVINVTNTGEEPVNYTFMLVNMRQLIKWMIIGTNFTLNLIKNLSPNYFKRILNNCLTTINGTVPANASIERIVPINKYIKFSPILATLIVDNNSTLSLAGTGYVFLGNVRFTRMTTYN